MIGNPLALAGLLAVAIPILIHLLGRHQSRIERFPTLRFIGASRLNPTRRRRISDWPLLIVRMAIVAAAAFALSQPLFHRAAGTDDALSRVVILDTSASMPPRVGTAPDTLAGNIVATEILTDSPNDAIPGAVAWLETRPGRREIVLVSDFQKSSVSEPVIPDGIGLSVIPTAGRDLHVQAPRFARGDIRVLAGPTDLPGATNAWRAVGRPIPTDTTARIAIIYRGFLARGGSIADTAALPIDSAWMARVVASVERDPTYAAVASKFVVANRVGSRLAFFVNDDAGSLASAALNQALLRATSTTPPASELDTAHWTASEVANWHRDAQPANPPTRQPVSDGRWFWTLALALIALETWMRSRKREADVAELPVTQERAA